MGFHVYKEDANPFKRLWPAPPAPLTEGVPQKTEVQDPGAGKAIQTIFDKYAEALPLIDDAERDKRVQSQEWRVEGAKEAFAIAQRWLDDSVRAAVDIFSSVPLNSEGRPMTTYEEVIDLFGGHMGPDRCSDTVSLSDKMRGLKRQVIEMQEYLKAAEAGLEKLLAPPSEEEKRQAKLWCKTAKWMQELVPVLSRFYSMEADAAFSAAAPPQPVS